MSASSTRAGTAAKEAADEILSGYQGLQAAQEATARFGRNALDIPKQTVSEDFGLIPASAGVPYTYWGIGRTDRQAYLAAEKARRLRDLPSNHSPKFLPPLQPTLRTGTEALVVVAMAWLGPH